MLPMTCPSMNTERLLTAVVTIDQLMVEVHILVVVMINAVLQA